MAKPRSTRVALVSDVHANLPALEAVLGHARDKDVEAIWNAGDTVGYGAFPNEVLELLRREHAKSILGNYDGKVLRFPTRERKWRKKKPAQKFLAFQWAHHALAEENLAYLGTLPDQIVLSASGSQVLITHGSPAAPNEHLSPETPRRRLRELASVAEADVVVCGHSHRPFARRIDDVLFVNPGSVGRPDDGDPRASYAVADFTGSGTQELEVRHHRVSYDTDGAAAALRERGLPEAFAQMAIRGLALDEAVAEANSWVVPSTAESGFNDLERKRRLDGVLALAERYEYEVDHSQHVTHLCLRLFDELLVLHRLSPKERVWLECGALLHDIGWVEGRKAHHKTSLRLIMEGLNDAFSARERRIVASIARYHRGAHPKGRHHHLAALAPVDQYRVTVLAGLLRVADGLDRTHRNVVQGVSCDVKPQDVTVTCEVRMYPGPERDAALEKGRLLERALDRELVISWRLV